MSSVAWTNLKGSPPFYPNIISRQPGARADIVKLIDRLRALNIPRGWGIKDSFCDLALADLGFEVVLKGSWFGGSPASKPVDDRWTKILSSDDLVLWEAAWGGEHGRRIFSDALLADHRIELWFLRPNDVIEAGFISFHSGQSVGLSNWFSLADQSIVDIGAFEIVAQRFPGLPIVFWASDDDPAYETDAVRRLKPLRVWISTT